MYLPDPPRTNKRSSGSPRDGVEARIEVSEGHPTPVVLGSLLKVHQQVQPPHRNSLRGVAIQCHTNQVQQKGSSHPGRFLNGSLRSLNKSTHDGREVSRSRSQRYAQVLPVRANTCWKRTEGGGDPANPQASQSIHVVWCNHHLHTSYVECVGGVPPPLNQRTKEALLSCLSRLGLHKVFEASCFSKRTGSRIKPAPPFINLYRVALR